MAWLILTLRRAIQSGESLPLRDHPRPAGQPAIGARQLARAQAQDLREPAGTAPPWSVRHEEDSGCLDDSPSNNDGTPQRPGLTPAGTFSQDRESRARLPPNARGPRRNAPS